MMCNGDVGEEGKGGRVSDGPERRRPLIRLLCVCVCSEEVEMDGLLAYNHKVTAIYGPGLSVQMMPPRFVSSKDLMVLI